MILWTCADLVTKRPHIDITVISWLRCFRFEKRDKILKHVLTRITGNSSAETASHNPPSFSIFFVRIRPQKFTFVGCLAILDFETVHKRKRVEPMVECTFSNIEHSWPVSVHNTRNPLWNLARDFCVYFIVFFTVVKKRCAVRKILTL